MKFSFTNLVDRQDLRRIYFILKIIWKNEFSSDFPFSSSSLALIDLLHSSNSSPYDPVAVVPARTKIQSMTNAKGCS